MSMLQKPISSLLGRPLGRSFYLPTFEEMGAVFHTSTYRLSDYSSLVLRTGIGPATTPHTANIRAFDFWEIANEFLPGEAVWGGGRFVRNVAEYSADLTQTGTWGVTSGGAAVDATTFRATQQYSSIRQIPHYCLTGHTYIYSFYARNISGNTACSVKCAGNLPQVDQVTLTGSVQRFSVRHTATSDGYHEFGVQDREGSGWGDWHITKSQIEDSTGRADTETPSGYIATTTAPVTKVHHNYNGNYVDPVTHAVTEGKGAALPVPPKLWAQGAFTSDLKYSTDLTNWTPYNSPNPVKELVSLDGIPNGAYTLEDNNPADYEHMRQLVAMPANTNTHTIEAWIPEEDTETHFPAIVVVATGLEIVLQLNKKTGEIAEIETIGSIIASDVAYSFGRWKLLLSFAGTGIAENVTVYLTPANGVVFGVSSNTAQGKTGFLQAELHLDKTIEQVKAKAGPIFTTTAPESTDELPPTFPAINHSNTHGPYVIQSFKSTGADQDLLLLGGTAFLSVEDGGVGTELFTSENAASSSDVNATTGFLTVSGCTLSSQDTETNNTNYAIKAEGNTSPAGASGVYFELPAITDGTAFIISFAVRHVGIGGLWRVGVGNGISSLGDPTIYEVIDVADTTWAVYEYTITKSAAHTHFVAREFSVTDDGGVYLDSITIKVLGKVLSLTDQTNKVTLPIDPSDDNRAAALFDANAGQMQLNLNGVKSAIGTYGGSLGSGILTYGVPTQDVLRFNKTSLAAQDTIADAELA